MLLDEILERLAGCGLRSMQTRFVSAPENEPFLVWDASVAASGADWCNPVRSYTAALSLVEHPGDGPAARVAVEATLDACGVEWTRQMREWSEDEHVYVTEYGFSWSEKAPRAALGR